VTRGEGAVLALAVISCFSPRFAGAQTPASGSDSAPPGRRAEVMPLGDLFAPLIADPKQPQFQLSYLAADSPVFDPQIGAVGFGETFGLVRLRGRRPGDGWQLDLAGAVFAQFDMHRQSTDLVNADYLVGLPIVYRHGKVSARLALHHQSSHLGDEYLTRENPKRLNVSWDAVQLLLARDCGAWRVYAGGDYVFVHAPEPLKDGVLDGGIEYRRAAPLFQAGAREAARLVAALDVQSWQAVTWELSWSARAGVELGPLGRADQGLGRTWSLLLEAFRGPTPFGQFYANPLSYLGLGLHFR
jgi:Protein of unknown function (DUF1207)